MKKLLNTIILTLIGTFAFSQEITVTNFRCIENDITARTEKVTDNNGDLCALIILNTPIRGFEFSSCPIEKTEQKTGAIYVYVSPGVKFITLMHKDYGMLKNYPFPETIKI